MKNYKLLTPGPLTTTDTVKRVMMFDHCTWDDDYKQITQEIRKKSFKAGPRGREGVHGRPDAGIGKLRRGERAEQRGSRGWRGPAVKQRCLRRAGS
mgnify:CR=1 FL=1